MKLLYIPIPSEEEAINLAKKLLKEGLIACANIISGSTSIYRWEGEIKQQKEFIIIAKTKAALSQKAMLRSRDLHPYELPCILILPVENTLPEFKDWVYSEASSLP